MTALSRIVRGAAFACGVGFVAALTVSAPARADAGFTRFVASLWPEAREAGVSRAAFEAETRGLAPDYKLPDLALPGRAPSAARTGSLPGTKTTRLIVPLRPSVTALARNAA